MTEAVQTEAVHTERVEFRVSPDRLQALEADRADGPVATLTMDVDEQGGLVPGYELKLNSYDLGVDIELYDAVQRLRFEHPEVRTVVITSGKPKIFCAGANIRMLAASPHGWKVNFCKFTNETRNGIEDATANSGPDLPGRGERHRVGRRVRAGAGLRAHHAGRRPVLGGVAAELPLLGVLPAPAG
jgi:Enoyl-CoA hydratase/carnithine racemase